jgi:hypothetical protein
MVLQALYFSHIFLVRRVYSFSLAIFYQFLYCDMTPESQSRRSLLGNEYIYINKGIVRKRCFLLGPRRGYITRILGQLK